MRNRDGSRRHRRGFTLLEAAVAMTIIGLVAAGALGAFGADMRAADRARRLLPAAALAQQRVSILDLVDPQLLRMLPDSLSHGTFDAPLNEYRWRASAKEVRGEPSLVQLDVVVEWGEGSFALSERRYRPMPAVAAQ